MGESKSGAIKASDREAAVRSIKELGLAPISVKTGSALNMNINFSFLNKVKTKDLAIYARQFSILLDAGIAVLAAIDILKRQTENKKLADVTSQMLEDVKRGNSLNAAMRKHNDVFPDIMLNMIEAGEVSGSIEGAFTRVATHLDNDLKILAKIKSSLTYSIVLGSVALIVCVFLIVGVVPSFMKMFTDMGVELPASTRALLSISDFVRGYWYILVSVIISLIVGFNYFKSTDNGKLMLDKFVLKLPIIGPFTKKIVTARFSRTLSALLESGFPLLSSLDVVAKIIGNKKYQKAIEKARNEVGNGVSLTIALSSTGMFMKMVLQMIKVGEDTGKMENVLDKIADVYEEEVSEMADKVSSLMEPVLIMFLAVVVGFIVISIIEPMFTMLQAVK